MRWAAGIPRPPYAATGDPGPSVSSPVRTSEEIVAMHRAGAAAAEILILAVIGGVVTAQLRRDTAAQKAYVVETMEERARQGLRDQLRLVSLLLEEDQWDCVRAVELVTSNPSAVAALEQEKTVQHTRCSKTLL